MSTPVRYVLVILFLAILGGVGIVLLRHVQPADNSTPVATTVLTTATPKGSSSPTATTTSLPSASQAQANSDPTAISQTLINDESTTASTIEQSDPEGNPPASTTDTSSVDSSLANQE
jgi:hypothetical protein